MSEIRESIIIYAARYAHGRPTGAALMVVNHIINIWHELSIIGREQILRESHEATECIPEWDKLRAFAEKSNDRSK